MWLLPDNPVDNLVLPQVLHQWDPPNQSRFLNLFFPPLTLQTNPPFQEWAQLVISGLLPLVVVVVFKVAARETGTMAEVEDVTSRGGQGGVATLNQGTLVLPMYPLVGMEVTKVLPGDQGTRLDVKTAVCNTIVGSLGAIPAILRYSEVILMMAVWLRY